ncbi:hypothetical protein BOX15_Mlig008328g3 [Macrostomum lignano]|uniref:CSN12-like protein n=2 Tax=Macrostomum lignano TaxID=282301 RepID=A0A1I8H054_9PLAT|nr:hypothetical protein BOX15_Mlig008328g3 [Macrostomum lignano]
MASFLRLDTYLDTIERAAQRRDGRTLASLLSLSHQHAENDRLCVENPELEVSGRVNPPWQEVVATHLRTAWSRRRGAFDEAFDCQTIIVQAFSRAFQAMESENWPLPVMLTLAVDLRRLACRCAAAGYGKKPHEHLEKAADSIMGLFRVCASDSRATMEKSKKWGMMGLCNQLFKIYFRINKLNLCKPMVRAIDNLVWPKDRFSLAQAITYNYYTGRKAIFEDNFQDAQKFLSFAFHRCHRRAHSNKRQILIYLIPVRMLLGSLPRQQLLRKYSLLQFSGIATAVRSGNVLQLKQELERNEQFFISCGIYLILEKLRMITYRNLFKKVFLILGSFQLDIAAFTAALQFLQEEDADAELTQCIVANLIYEGKIRGYIAYQQQKLVVSKQQAFPSIFACGSN